MERNIRASVASYRPSGALIVVSLIGSSSFELLDRTGLRERDIVIRRYLDRMQLRQQGCASFIATLYDWLTDFGKPVD